MCGLVGVAGKLLTKDEGLVKKMLLWDWIRGPDATGLASIRSNGDVFIAKVSDHPLALFEMNSFNRALNGNQSTVFMGHNRAATKGKNSHSNAHPFEFGDIIGAHNGTLEWSSHRDLEDKLGETFEVDSQALIASIARFGLKETISMIKGSWSIVYYDKSNNTLNMIRNKERPMYYAYTKEYDRLFYASEYEFMRSAINLTGGYELFVNKDNIGYFSTDVDTHYQWDVEVLKTGGKYPKPRTKKIEGKKDEPRGGGSHGFFPTRTGTQGRSTGTPRQGTGNGTSSTRTTSTTGSGTSTSDIKVMGSPKKPFGDWYTKEEFQARTPYGCSWCEEPVEFGVGGLIINERDNTVLCPSCTGTARRNIVTTKANPGGK